MAGNDLVFKPYNIQFLEAILKLYHLSFSVKPIFPFFLKNYQKIHIK